ncbi:MAG: ABC transporter permease, partial [Candidatus Eisenbacteria bacterium]
MKPRTGLFAESLRMALTSVRLHKMRSGLTLLGIVIGITTLVGMVSLVQGLNQSMARQIKSLGTSVLYVRKFEPGLFMGEVPDSLRHRKDFTTEDALAVSRFCPSVAAAAAVSFVGVPLKYRDRETRFSQVVGSWPEYLEIHDLAISSGRSFTEEEVLHKADVCILGQELLETLFPQSTSVGRWILMGGKRFLVVGELEKRGRLLGNSLDDYAIVPQSTLKKRFGSELQTVIDAKPVSVERTQGAIEEITELLRRRRGVPLHRSEEFAVLTEDVI